MQHVLLPPPVLARSCLQALRQSAACAHRNTSQQHPLLPCLLSASAYSTDATEQQAPRPLKQIVPYKTERHPISLKPKAYNALSRRDCSLERYRLPGWVPPPGYEESRRAKKGQHLLSVPEASAASGAAIGAVPGSDQAFLLESAVGIISRLRNSNELAFISGGWVRDALLGRPSADIDIATSASVQTQVPTLMHEYTTKQLTRGMARLTRAGLQFEIAQFRGPIRESSLGSAYLDACLRDFTINGIFFDPLTGDVLDFVGGVKDLKHKILRMPPYGLSKDKTADVFSTDPIRCLRSVRFAAGFGLSVDSGVTKKEIMRHAHRCKFDAPDSNRGALNLGNRRLFKELQKLANTGYASPLGHAAVPYGLALAAELGVLQSMFPALATDPDNGQDLGYLTPLLVRRVQDALPPDSPLELRLAALVNPWNPTTAVGQLDGLLLSMHDQARPGSQQCQWDTEPVQHALRYVQFLASLFKPLEDQGPDSPLWQDGHALLSCVDSQDKAVFTRLLVYKYARALEAAALAHLPGSESDVGAALGGQSTASADQDLSSSPRAYIASRLRLVWELWGDDIKMISDSHARMEQHRKLASLQGGV